MSHRGIGRGSTWREANAKGPPRLMEVSIPQNNLRVFAAAVQCLMKVGKELFIEATAEQLILRTLNDAKSAFAAFYFNEAAGFFESYRCEQSASNGARSQGQDGADSQGSAAETAAVEGGNVSCKIQVRAVHSILRTLKKVVRLVIYIEAEDEDHIEPHLVFQMYCEYGYRKVHRLSLQDCEIMHAVFEPEGASRLSCPPVQLCQLLEHIHGTAEVAVGASYDVLTVRSFHHPLTGSAERAVLKTEMSISTAEFDTYSFCGTEDEEVELVFSLKEVKALLHFCESAEAQSLEMLFREGGDPLLFQSHSNTFAGELIMATMEPRIVRDDPERVTPAAAWSNDARHDGSSGQAHGRGEDRKDREDREDHHEEGGLLDEGHEGDGGEDNGTGSQDQRGVWRTTDLRPGDTSDGRDVVETGGHTRRRCREEETGRAEQSSRGPDEADWREGGDNTKGSGSWGPVASAGDREVGEEDSQATKTPTSSADEHYHQEIRFGPDSVRSLPNLKLILGRDRTESGTTRRIRGRPGSEGQQQLQEEPWDDRFGRESGAGGCPVASGARRSGSPAPGKRNKGSRAPQASVEPARTGGRVDRSRRHSAAGRHEPEPQSEMPTQFPGLRGASGSAEEESADLLAGAAASTAVSAVGEGGDFGGYCDQEGPDPRRRVRRSPERPMRARRGGEALQGLNHESRDSDEDGMDPIHVPGKRKRRIVQDEEDGGGGGDDDGGMREEARDTRVMSGHSRGRYRGNRAEDHARRT